MTEALWWEKVLQNWSHTVDARCQVNSTKTAAPSSRKTGDWWRNGAEWCVQLDAFHYAAFDESSVDFRLRRSFSWTLQALQEARTPTWQMTVLEWVRACSGLDNQSLSKALRENRQLAIQTSLAQFEPGYLVWVHILPQVAPKSQSDLEDTLTQVIEAYVPGGILGWLKTGDGGVSVVVRLNIPQENTDIEDNGLEEPDVSGREQVRRDAEEFIQVLATDAFALCEAAVGAYVASHDDLYLGAATMVAAWRDKKWANIGAHSQKVSMWGDYPLAHLLAPLPLETIHSFVSAARLNAPFRLPAELQEALHGVVQANLNVSEAARLLYLHRNTLINRIERIRQHTGYDIRNFHDALTLWLAVMLTQTGESV